MMIYRLTQRATVGLERETDNWVNRQYRWIVRQTAINKDVDKNGEIKPTTKRKRQTK